ncbi:Xenotropic and polytropic retrovirus receptor 1 [Malassezia cuniculi]|uniref:Xenotropic and polytropic retrovirus receptor 1 n=1 Tax=Malassezia cuniculi TaxID=948313 RepID=A0AAF0EVV5_9BASI|nr:Xenotropic and polytropic retrovirus receptor 1 [Malassezia cuniculi]
MKFGRYLEENAADEWRRAYINYRGLKKLIKRVDAHYRARTDREIEKPAPPRTTGGLFRIPLLARSVDGQPEAVPNYGSTAAAPEEPLQPIEVDDLELTLAPERHRPSAAGQDLELRPSQTVDERIHDIFDHEERKFFRAVDAEVDRIERFYQKSERDAIDRLHTLVAQLSELAEHRRAYRAQAHHENVMHRLSIGSVEVPKTDGEDAGDARRARAIHVMHELDIKPAHASHESHVPHDPQRYIAARKKLRAAVVENYRVLEILNNYRFLNRQGFSKILKKFDKALGTSFLNDFYADRVLGTPLTDSDRVPKMIQGTEEVFASYFVHGDVKKARDILRQSNGTQVGAALRYHGVVFMTGLYLGLSACAVAAGLAAAHSPATQAVLPQWKQLIQVYATLFVPTLFALLFGLNLVGWHHARINSVFIFEWDAATALDPVQYFELPSVFLLSLCTCFWISFQFPNAFVSPTTLPFLWIAFIAGMLANPLPVFQLSGRMWFLRSMARVCGAGIARSVQFRDFFLGDELNSLAWSLSNLWYVTCQGAQGWPMPDTCAPTRTYWTPLLAALPAALRLGQCIRRYVDSERSVNIHIINAFKYLASIVAPFAYFWYQQSVGSSVLFAFWCLAATVNSTYTASWDLIMDWNLLTPNTRYPLLREKLAFDDIWPMYYVAMVSNVMLRFAWVLHIFGAPASPLARAILLALLEMLRRWQWNFIRLENEHLGNADSFKIIRDMPLPYPTCRVSSDDDDDGQTESPSEDKGSAEHNRQVLRRAITALVATMPR